MSITQTLSIDKQYNSPCFYIEFIRYGSTIKKRAIAQLAVRILRILPKQSNI